MDEGVIVVVVNVCVWLSLFQGKANPYTYHLLSTYVGTLSILLPFFFYINHHKT